MEVEVEVFGGRKLGMRPNAARYAILLIRTGFAPQSHNLNPSPVSTLENMNLKMKMKTFFSPNCYQLLRRFSHTPLLSLPHNRFFSKSPANSRDDALVLYEKMTRMRPLPSVIEFTQLLTRVVHLREYSTAIRLFKDICNLDIPVNEYTLNIVVKSYCHCNRADYGFPVLGMFFKRGCAPDAITFSTLLRGLFMENRINEALELFLKITREELCELNVILYGTVIDGLCKKMKIDTALKLFDEMCKKGISPNVIVYSSLIHGLCSLSRWEQVHILLGEMIDHKICPNVVTFTCIADALCKKGLVDKVEDVLLMMMRHNVVPNVVSYNVLIHCYCSQGRVDEARKVLDSMVSKNVAPDVHSYNILIDGYCTLKKIDDAIHLFMEMHKKGLRPNVVTYTSLLQGLFRVGRCSDAVELFDELQAVGLKPNFYTYCNLLHGLCQNQHRI
ncbi:hypothetical protein ACS0TY_026204 [Phlomoides rotata]